MLPGFRLLVVCLLPFAAVMPARSADAPRVWAAEEITPVTAERVMQIPERERAAWLEYLTQSAAIARQVPAVAKAEFSPAQPVQSGPGARHARGLKLDSPAEWYGSEQARVVADHVVTWQTGAGAWTKGNDYSIERPRATSSPDDVWSRGTFDNDATTTELRFLARVIAAAGDDARANAWRDAFVRGVTYIFNAQYPNGGFPQIYPLAGGYHDAITYNDNGMGRVLDLLGSVSAGTSPFGFVPPEIRTEAGRRFARGISCVVASQIVESSGRRTGWCQQHDALTLKPCPARNFEPIAVTTQESVYLVALLMKLPNPTPDVRRAVDSAVAWLKKVQLKDIIWTRENGVGIVRHSPGAKPLWSRLYEVGTDKPIFGDRDHTIHYDVNEISEERRRGYAWYNDSAESVLEKYPAWQQKHPGSL